MGAMMGGKSRAEAVGSVLARGVGGKAERGGNGLPEQGVADRAKDQAERGFGDMMILVAESQPGDQYADRFEDRVERVAIAGEDHPRRQRPGALLAESVEHAVDDDPGIGFAGTGLLDLDRDQTGDRIGDRAGERALQPRGGAEMVEQIGMGAADAGGNGLQGHRLRALGEQERPGGVERGRAALLLAQAAAFY